MSTGLPTPEQSDMATPSRLKSPRPLACVPCQQRKNRRRKCFPERALLDRLRKYESLLRQNNVRFDPLHRDRVGSESSNDSDHEQHDASDTHLSHPVNSSGPKKSYEAKSHSYLPAMADLSRNVDPLLKVTHTPSLQGRIIEAAGNLASINPVLEALIFGIYCMAILSLSVDDCQNMFGSSKEDLLAKPQFSCQQALSNCEFLRSSDRDALTAFYLYLVSSFSDRNPRSLSSMLTIAIRIAQRTGIHNEATLARYSVIEAEMRRRLWWSLVLFDSRISEITEYSITVLAPTWDCKIPLNVSYSDLQTEMKEPPVAREQASEAIYAVTRSELGEFIHHAPFHLDFTNPALKPIAKDLPDGGDIGALEKIIEKKYLETCDPQNPLHFMTIWMTRAQLARYHLVEHYSKYSNSSSHSKESQRDAAMSHALGMLECDTKIMTSPLTKQFHWFLHSNFPFFAYIYILQRLKERPINTQAEQAWEVMSDNYEARFGSLNVVDNPLFRTFIQVVLPAWDSFEVAFKRHGESLSPPRIVSDIRQKLTEIPRDTETPGTDYNTMTGLKDRFTAHEL
ncbi:fungal specific transcription factor domain-containing protein [Aspergillus affinis]|uniref:fungal specific transcription factor domain-containing protein n=1 Tax=Aspergillus affinis TaxID=1070780 RepID=UPI0022FDE373|nr:uncharacterized protein KD926_008564 [Aspergillus affinis]KAI9040120.1 hypothetical protein KD926_008564 [Aspergillus affinis]